MQILLYRRLTTLLAVLLCLTPALAQEGAFHVSTGAEIPEDELRALLPPSFDLFGSEEPLELEIISDFRHLIKKKFRTQYQPATLAYRLNDSVVIRRGIEIKARGNSRREICTFPPVKINFKHTDFIVEDLRELNKMKMVSYCNRGKAFEGYLLKEYLTYRMLNLLTPNSFRARLIRMRYVDTGRDNKSLDSYAMLLEPVKEMEKRLDAVELEEVAVHPNATDQEQMAIVDLFQFLIGNYDWSVIGLHNVKLFHREGRGERPYLAVPYDFDYCGLVDAHYAIPPEELSIKSVRERLYRGFCRTPEAMEPTRQLFLDNKEAIYALIDQLEPLDQKWKKRMQAYLDEGFRILEKPKVFANYLDRDCRRQ